METAQKFFKGEKLDEGSELSPYIYEFVICSTMGWSIDYVRSLDVKDFYMYLRLCLIKEGANKEFDILLHGGGKKAKSKGADKSKFDMPTKQEQKGTFRQVKREKAISFSSSVKPVWVSRDKLNQQTKTS